MYIPLRITFCVSLGQEAKSTTLVRARPTPCCYCRGRSRQGNWWYDLKSRDDVAFAFDWDSSGRADHIALYRPGTGTFWVLKHA